VIPERVFEGCNKISSITTHAAIPPVIGSNAFQEVPITIPVIIPCLSFNGYKNATGWKDFTNFVVLGSNTFSYTAKCYFPYNDNYFSNLTATGTYKTHTLFSGDNCETQVILTLLSNSAPQLCMITVDQANHNEIVWKNYETDVTYKIFREGAQSGEYDLVGIIPPNSSNKWVDMESNAKIRSYRYKVLGVDQYGKESTISEPHKSMHLTINAGMNNSWNLIWTPYEGTSYSTYNIYRASGENLGNFELIGTMPAGNSSFSDFGAPAGYVYYMVEIMLNETCSVGKAGSSIKSNVATNNPGAGIGALHATSIEVYPNPTTGELTITNYELGITSIEIFDIYGRNLSNHLITSSSNHLINIAHFPAGIYFVKISTEVGEVVRKVVKE
jgi:hypothetical protein